MRHLFAIQASFGHLLPAMRLASLMRERGHDTLFVATNQYSGLLDLYGLPHMPVSNLGLPFLATHDWYDANSVAIQLQVLQNAVERYRPDVLVTCPLGMATFMLGEIRSLPVVVIGYGEYLYPGLNDNDPTRWWRLRTLTGFYNACRKLQNLEPIAADVEASPLLGSCYLLRNVPQFTSPSTLPARVRHAGGLYWEPPHLDTGLRHFLATSRGRYRRTVYVQIGRLFDKSWIWTRLMRILEDLDVACVADVGRADYLTDFTPPPNCYVTQFAPVGCVENADAVICSGHTAAVLGAITHRKPLLCLPSSADAEESTARVVASGLGMKISVDTNFHPDAFKHFFSSVDRGVFAEHLLKFQGYLADWKQKEGSLGDIGLSLI